MYLVDDKNSHPLKRVEGLELRVHAALVEGSDSALYIHIRQLPTHLKLSVQGIFSQTHTHIPVVKNKMNLKCHFKVKCVHTFRIFIVLTKVPLHQADTLFL